MPLERIDEALNSALEEVLGRQPWRSLRGEIVVPTVAKYDTGTVAVTNGAVELTGTGTVFTEAMQGRKIRIGSDAHFYEFGFIDDVTGELDRYYEGETNAEASFRIFQNIVRLAEDVAAVRSVTYPTIRELTQTTKAAINAADAGRLTSGDPTHWAPDYKTDPNSPPSVTAIELFPAPEEAWPLAIEFRRLVIGFDGTNTSDSPPEWVSSGAILSIAKRELGLGDGAQAEVLIDGMIQTEIEGQVGGVRIPRSTRFRPSPAPSWRSSPGVDAWDRSD